MYKELDRLGYVAMQEIAWGLVYIGNKFDSDSHEFL